MRDKQATRDFYVDRLDFQLVADYHDYLILERDNIQIHFFAFEALDPKENYGQVYIRTDDIAALFELVKRRGVKSNNVETKPWGQTEFFDTRPR